MRVYDFGDSATGIVANPDDWTKTGPRVKKPRTTKWGIVTGLFAGANNAVSIQTDNGETYCIRVDIR